MATPKTRLPLLSVVVPSYNQARFLSEALDSIFRQAYPRLEVVVMDGGSTDDSVAILESYAPRLKYWQSRPDGGQAAAVNAGVAHCKGDLVAWLNSDDFYWGDALWTVARAYRAYPGRGLYVGNGFRYDQHTGRHTPFIPRHVAFNREALRHGPDYLLQPSTFFLRQAWERVGGLDARLQFCMDWDIFLRIARDCDVVLVNEFLGVSREYDETKTRSGKLKRADEILRMIKAHTDQETTPGSLIYLISTMLELTGGSVLGEVRMHLGHAVGALCQHFSMAFGGGHWAPEISDAQDRTYLAAATADDVLPFGDGRLQIADCRLENTGGRAALSSNLQSAICNLPSPLPSLGIIVPCHNRLSYLDDTLSSLFAQQYPRLEAVAVGNSLGSEVPDAVQKYQDRLSYRRSEMRRGLAGAVNEGLAHVGGDVLGWITPGDRLTAGALREVGRAFAADPELDLVYANAAYIDIEGRPCLADHGAFRSGFCYGVFERSENDVLEHPFIYAVPQTTVFFRRRLLEQLGPLDESYRLIHGYELFLRYARHGKVQKIERTQALCRLVGSDGVRRWNAMLVELYRYNRRRWPAVWSRGFADCLKDFVNNYLRRKFRGQPWTLGLWAKSVLIGAAAVTRLFNPERLWSRRLLVPNPPPPLQIPPPDFSSAPVPMDRQDGTLAGGAADDSLRRRGRSASFSSLVCAPDVPVHPGRSGGEEREYQFLRQLMRVSTVQMFSYGAAAPPPGRRPVLVDLLYTPATISLFRPDLVSLIASQPLLRTRMSTRLRRRGVPVLGPRCPVHVTEQFCRVRAFVRAGLQDALNRQQPDFLFIAPQTNPVALTLSTRAVRTRLILVAHQIEADALRREAAGRGGLEGWARLLEASRARRFERRNLSRFDGVIVPSEEERRVLADAYGYPAERVLVLPQGTDSAARQELLNNGAVPRIGQKPSSLPPLPGPATPGAAVLPLIAFHGSLEAEANRTAVRRLLRDVWPLVRRRHAAELWVLNPGAAQPLAEAEGVPDVRVFHEVEDVRAQLARVAAVCLPLPDGSGVEGAVLETLAAGVPLICPASAAAAPLEEGTHFLAGQTDEDLAAAVCRVLEDTALAEDLRRCGRDFAGAYSWEACLSPLGDWLKHVAALPRYRWSKTGPAATGGSDLLRASA